MWRVRLMSYAHCSVGPPPVPVQIVHPHSRLVAAKVRALLDFAAPRLKERLTTPLNASGPG